RPMISGAVRTTMGPAAAPGFRGIDRGSIASDDGDGPRTIGAKAERPRIKDSRTGDRIRMGDPASNNPGEPMLEALVTGVQTPGDPRARRARQGDGAAFGELYERHRGAAYRVAHRQLGHEQDALDVVQEAMIKAFAGLGDFDGRSGFRTWLLRIVVNTALDWGRRRKRRPSFQMGDGMNNSHEPNAPDDPGRRIHQKDLRRA